MTYDVECPYCGEGQEINHDDGYGYEEDRLHEQGCGDCDKTFTFTTGIIYVYHSFKAECLNGGQHNVSPTITYPKRYTKMICSDCEYERPPTISEWANILLD